MLCEMFHNKKYFVISSLIILLFEGCAPKYVRTEERDIPTSTRSTLKVTYEFSALSVNIACSERTKAVVENKNFYERGYENDFKGAFGNSSCCSYTLLPILRMICPPVVVHTKQDTVTRILPLEFENVKIKYLNISKVVATNQDGILNVTFRELGVIPLDKNLQLQIVSSQLEDSTNIIIPVSILKNANKTENEAKVLLLTEEKIKDQKQFDQAIDICKKIITEYQGTYAAEIITRNNEVEILKNSLIKYNLEKMAYIDLDDFLQKNGVQKSTFLIMMNLDKLPVSTQILAVIYGIGLQFNESQAWDYFQKLNAYQRLYAVMKLVELTVGNEPMYKAEMLKEWFSNSMSNKIAYISSRMMELFLDESDKKGGK